MIPFSRSKEQVIAEMHAKGLRVTLQREAILDYILSTDEHPSARRILENVKKKAPHICLSTVYGTLVELKKNNIIKELEFAEMENRYEANLSQHVNLVCVRCGRIQDYPTTHTIDTDQVRQTARFQTLQSRFELYGICSACSTG